MPNRPIKQVPPFTALDVDDITYQKNLDLSRNIYLRLPHLRGAVVIPKRASRAGIGPRMQAPPRRSLALVA
jgi:hypothetical protein